MATDPEIRTPLDRIAMVAPRPMRGRITEITGQTLKARMPRARLGEVVTIFDRGQAREARAVVVGKAQAEVVLSAVDRLAGFTLTADVIGSGQLPTFATGLAPLGSVVDCFGRPLTGDDRPVVTDRAQPGDRRQVHPGLPARLPFDREAPRPLARPQPRVPFETGVRAIDGPLTLAVGQRVGIFGAPGCGKSTLLAMILGAARADVAVIGLVGERGREVREFLALLESGGALDRSILVVATSDRPAGERVCAAEAATAVAEAYRDLGADVLLVVDSVTRVARAQREIGLAAGEMPTRRAFPVSAFTALPPLFERAGLTETGSITGLYTVLMEGDGVDDPVAEEVRGLLDGHIVLSERLAAEDHFPAIDVLKSRSRLMDQIVCPDHREAAQRLRHLQAAYEDISLLLKVGEYRSGADPTADHAIAVKDDIDGFLRQPLGVHAHVSDTVAAMAAAVSSP
ncbi:MAG: FliI/YscN family ATPase [Pseudomonadota bacterium]